MTNPFGRRSGDNTPNQMGVIPFNIMWTIIVAVTGVLGSYFGNQISNQKNLAELSASIQSIKQHNDEVVDPTLRNHAAEIQGIYKGIYALLAKEDIDPAKVLGGELTTGGIIRSQ